MEEHIPSVQKALGSTPAPERVRDSTCDFKILPRQVCEWIGGRVCYCTNVGVTEELLGARSLLLPQVPGLKLRLAGWLSKCFHLGPSCQPCTELWCGIRGYLALLCSRGFKPESIWPSILVSVGLCFLTWETSEVRYLLPQPWGRPPAHPFTLAAPRHMIPRALARCLILWFSQDVSLVPFPQTLRLRWLWGWRMTKKRMKWLAHFLGEAI